MNVLYLRKFDIQMIKFQLKVLVYNHVMLRIVEIFMDIEEITVNTWVYSYCLTSYVKTSIISLM